MDHDGRTETDRPAGAQLVLGSLVSLTRWLGATTAPTPPPDAGGTDAGGTDGDGSPAAAPTGPPDLRFVVLGAAAVLEDRARRAVTAAARTTGAAATPVVGAVAGFVPAALRRPVQDAVHRLDERGRATATASADEAGRIVEALAGDLVDEPVFVHTIEHVVDRLQWEVIDAVLPVVLDRLAAEPEQVRVLVQGQSRGMVEEVARQARSRAADGDAAVDRAVGRLLRRRRNAASAPPNRAVLGPAAPPGAGGPEP